MDLQSSLLWLAEFLGLHCVSVVYFGIGLFDEALPGQGAVPGLLFWASWTVLQVGRLEGIMEWTHLEQELAIATNEYLERTLLELDNVTNLQGDDRLAKKAAVTHVNKLCSRLDSIRLKHDGS